MENQPPSRPPNRLLLFFGFLFLGLAAFTILFGEQLFGDANDGSSILDQVEPLALQTPSVVRDERFVNLEIGDPAPDFSLVNLEGETVSFADLAGKQVVLNFWATWCAPCIIEMPELQAFHEDNQSDGVVVLGLNRDEDEAQVRRFLQEDLEGTVTFPILLDMGAAVAEQYQVFNMPTTYFVNGNGVISAVHRGPLTRSQLEGYLAESVSGRP